MVATSYPFFILVSIIPTRGGWSCTEDADALYLKFQSSQPMMAGSKSRLMLPYDKIFQSSCPGWAGLHATTIYRCPPHSITGSKSRTFISKGALIHHAVSSINLYKLGSWSQSRPYLFYPHFNNHLDLYRFSLFR